MATYHPLLLLHIGCVAASGALFLVRGLGRLAAARWTMAPVVRFASYGIDTVLLADGVALTVATHQYPVSSPWLRAKLLGIAAYIVLGSFALKRATSGPARVACLVAALAMLAFVASIAIAHDPRGFLAGPR